jgi:hypothetical protein
VTGFDFFPCLSSEFAFLCLSFEAANIITRPRQFVKNWLNKFTDGVTGKPERLGLKGMRSKTFSMPLASADMRVSVQVCKRA